MVARDEDEYWLKQDNKVSELDEVKKTLDESYSALGKSIKSLMECVGNDPGKFFDSMIDSIRKRPGVMMTKYQKDIVRMWNSLRSDEYKDDISCIGVSCARCPLTEYCPDIEHTGVFRNAQIAIKVVTDWAKENPDCNA